MKITRVMPVALFVLAGLAAGCSSGYPTPSTPTPVVADASAGSDDAARGGGIQISGTVARVSGTCPSLSFLAGRVTVRTDRATVFTGGTCARVVNGVGAVATGARQADGSLAASSVALRTTATR